MSAARNPARNDSAKRALTRCALTAAGDRSVPRHPRAAHQTSARPCHTSPQACDIALVAPFRSSRHYQLIDLLWLWLRSPDADFRTVTREHDPEKWVLVFGKDHAPAIVRARRETPCQPPIFPGPTRSAPRRR